MFNHLPDIFFHTFLLHPSEGVKEVWNSFKKAKSLVLKQLFTNYLSFKQFLYHSTITIIF